MKIGILYDGASATAPDQLITGTMDAVAAELASEGNEIGLMLITSVRSGGPRSRCPGRSW